MAQSDSCPNPDMSNGTIVHSPVAFCSDLNTHRGRGDEEEEEEDEEVELAEEVGEDVLMMGEAGERHAGERREQGETEEVKLIQLALLPNEAIKEGEGGGERPEENGQRGVEVRDEEHEKTDEHIEKEGKSKGAERSKDTKTVTENLCYFPAIFKVEKDNQQILHSDGKHGEDSEKEVNNQDSVKASAEKKARKEKTDEADRRLEDQRVSTTDDAETAQGTQNLGAGAQKSEEGTQLSCDNTDKTEVVTLPTNGEVTERNEQVKIQDGLCQTSTVSDNVIPFDATATVEVGTNKTCQSHNENQGEIKNTDEKDSSESRKQEVDSTNNNITWQQKDGTEAEVTDERTEKFLNYAMSLSDHVLDTESRASQGVKQPELASVPSEEQPQTEGGIEETKIKEINQNKPKESQVQEVGVNIITMMDRGEHCTEETGKTGDNVVRELTVEEEHRGRDYLEMQEENIVQLQNQAKVAPPESVLQCVEDVPLDTQQDVDLDQVEEAFELEEGGEGDLNQTRGEVKLENESTTEGRGDLQEHPSQPLNEAGTDWGETLWEQLREPALVEDEKGVGAEEEAMEGEVEMAEEPVTVLDDEIEEIEESQSRELKEQNPATIITPAEDAAFQTKDGVHQELEKEEVELGKENDERQKEEKVERHKEMKLKDEKPEAELDINGRVKGLNQEMENGILCPEPQPYRKEVWRTARLLSPKRKDNDWIKKDQPEEETAPEMKEWRKDLKPVKKDIWESERGRKECVKKEPLTEEKNLPRKEDWIKELKSVIKDESQPKKRDEHGKKKRVVLLEDGHSYIPQQEEMTEERREEVKLISHRRVESPLPPVCRNSRTSRDQEYEISLYVKVMKHIHIASPTYTDIHILYVHPESITPYIH